MWLELHINPKSAREFELKPMLMSVDLVAKQLDGAGLHETLPSRICVS